MEKNKNYIKILELISQEYEGEKYWRDDELIEITIKCMKEFLINSCDETFDIITSNGCREMTKTRVKQAISELIEI